MVRMAGIVRTIPKSTTHYTDDTMSLFSVNKLHSYVLDYASTRTVQKFRFQMGGQRRKTIAAAAKYLNIVTGKDPLDLIQILSRKYSNYNNIPLCIDKLRSIYCHLCMLHNNSSGMEKMKMLSLVAPHVTFTQLRRDGWKTGRQAYRKAKCGDLSPRQRTSTVVDRHKSSIKKFIHNNSKEAANRSIGGVPVRYLNNSISALHRNFQNEENISISKTSFRKCIEKHYKKAKKQTDKCELCELGKMHKRRAECMEGKLDQLRDQKKRRIGGGDQSNIDHEIKKIRKNLKKLQEQLDFYNHHVEANTTQREEFKKQRKNLGNGACQVVIDFKENISIGGGSVETGRDFYNKSNKTVLGMVVYYKSNKKIEKKRICFFSDVLSHDAIFASGCIDMLLEQDWFKWKTIHFWMDCGPHFRCKNMLGYIFGTLPDRGYNGTCNFFVEHHGKNECDSMFSTISMWKRDIEASLPEGSRITHLQQLVDLLYSKLSPQNQSLYQFFVYDEPDPHPSGLSFTVKNIKTYYCIKKIKKKKRVSLHLYSGDSRVKTKAIKTKPWEKRKKTKHSHSIEDQSSSYGSGVMSVFRNRLVLASKTKARTTRK